MSTQSYSDPPYKAFGLKVMRLIGDKTQAQLARELYLSQPEANHILNGKRRPAPWRVGLLAFLYNASPEELAQLAGYDLNPDAFQQALDYYNDRQSNSR